MVSSVEPPSTRTTSYPSDRSGRRTSRLRASFRVGRTIETRGCAKFLPSSMATPVKTSPSRRPPQAVYPEPYSTSRESEKPESHENVPADVRLTRGDEQTCASDVSVKRSSTEVAQVLEEQRGHEAQEKHRGGQHHGVAQGRSKAGLHE